MSDSPSKWDRCKVSELQVKGILLVEDGNHGEYRPHLDEYGREGIPFIRIPDMSNGFVDFDSADRIGPTARARIRKGIGAPGDVLISHKGTIGKVAFAPLNSPEFVCSPQTTFWRAMNTDRLDRRYLYYYLLSPDFQAQFDSRKNETDMAGYVSLTAQRTMSVVVPPILEQRAIARVLGSLDDKIELNRRTNQTLEQIANALFKFWFVDFGPVRAKAEGRWKKGQNLPGMPADMWDLWPSEFGESEIGEIPKGWDVSPISLTVEVNPERRLARDHNAPYVDMGALPTSSARVRGWVERQFASGSRFSNGDTLVARITPCLENGKTGYIDFLKAGQVGWGSTEFLVLSPKPPLPPQFAYCLARTEDFRSHLIQNMTGTSGRQRAPADCLESFPLAVPSTEVAHRFGTAVGPWFDSMKSNDEEASTLERIRDTLLPKLLSGEIRVPILEDSS